MLLFVTANCPILINHKNNFVICNSNNNGLCAKSMFTAHGFTARRDKIFHLLRRELSRVHLSTQSA